MYKITWGLIVLASTLLPYHALAADQAQVVSFSPQGTIKEVRQVRAQFSEAMVAFGDPRLFAPFVVRCPEAGKGFWEDDRNWVYDFSRDLPAGIVCEFALRAEVTTLSQKTLSGQKSFKFSTGGPSVRWSYPGEGLRIAEDQVFVLLVDAKPTNTSVEKNAYFSVDGIEERVPLEVIEGDLKESVLKSDTVLGMLKDPKKSWVPVVLRAKRRFPSSNYQKGLSWKRGNRVQLVWGSGISSESGVLTEIDQTFRFMVRPVFYAEFSCERENAESGCVPLSDMTVRFSSGIPWRQAKTITLQSGNKTWNPDEKKSAPRGDPDGISHAVIFSGPFPAKTDFRVLLPASFRDEEDRELSNAASFPLDVKTEDDPPLAEFPRTFGILELNADPILPVTLRNVEPELKAKLLSLNPKISEDTLNFRVLRPSTKEFANIATWLARIDSHTRAYDARGVSLFREVGADVDLKNFSVKKPNGPAAFEVVGVPLPKPGFYLVELESPILGAAILTPATAYYIQTAALVTNLAVHFKWGREGSLAWVTSLDRGDPVSDALVSIRNCRGEVLTSGKTDAKGIFRILSLPRRADIPKCDLPGKSRGSSLTSGLFAIAEKAGDFSFVHSSWSEGIESYRFQLRSEPYAGPKIAHTVFDRTLLRAGETVHMKHFLRLHTSGGFGLVPEKEWPRATRIQHRGSLQQYVLPLTWDKNGTAATDWVIPREAKLGEYAVSLDEQVPAQNAPSGSQGGDEDEGYESEDRGANANDSSASLMSGRFGVEEFRIPLMKAQLLAPKEPVVASTEIPLDIHVDYLAGGPASNLPVQVRYEVARQNRRTYEEFDGFWFGGGPVSEDYLKEEAAPPKSQVTTRPLILDKSGSAKTVLKIENPKQPGRLFVELEYSDPDGETQTSASSVPVFESSSSVGLKLDSWLAKREKFRFWAAVADLNGKAVAGAPVEVTLFEGRTYSHRKKLVGGFYAYEHRYELKKLSSVCSGKTDSKGRLECESGSPVAGNVFLQAQTSDRKGRPSYTTESLWLWDKEPWWFDVSDSDRIDLLPERKRYEPGKTARFQVRMPFSKAQVLVTVEREGILDAFTTRITREKPIVEVPLKKTYAPNVFVSALVVRGRVGDIQPTAVVDLGRPSYKLGMAEIFVGWKAHELQLQVQPEKSEYRVRDRAKVKIVAKLGGAGVPSLGTEVAVAAVDEGLLELKANESWKLLEAMMRPRGYEVSTASAQMQVVGKRHFGLKALPQGGGGGRSPARELFDTLLFWNPRVPLNSKGEAEVEIPLNDSLTSFRIVAVANAGVGEFGTGSSSLRTYQELSLFSAIPQLVREGDKLQTGVTVRNGSKAKLQLEVGGRIVGTSTRLETRPVSLEVGESKLVQWPIQIPAGMESATYEIEAREKTKGISDKIRVQQLIKPAVPVRVVQATSGQLEGKLERKMERPKDALAERGGLRLTLSPTLVRSLDGVRDYMRQYPYSCLEQKISTAVALQDEKGWKSLMAALPSYLDEDGLAKFFPTATLGCDCLTAYLLSIANEADWQIPDDLRGKMIDGLQKFVDGKIHRYSSIQTADLSMRRLAALEALSRYGDVPETAVKAVANWEQANVWPTSAVIDFYGILKRSKTYPDREVDKNRAGQILRSRLNFRGTTMGFSTERLDRLWWLMVSNDLNANQFLLSVLDEPDWKTDVPRIVQGTLGRQQNGHWDLTTANAWGVLAIKKFSAQFEKTAVSGKTTASVGLETKTTDWAKQPSGNSFKFPWSIETGTVELLASHLGGGCPWLTLQSMAAVPLRDSLFKGYQIKKTLVPVEQRKKGRWSRGDVVRVRLEIDGQADMGWVVVTDPVPAGASILGSGLAKDSRLLTRGEEPKNWWSAPTFVERSFEAYRAYYEFMPKGPCSLEYTVRLNQAGDLNLPPTRVEAMYAPEAFGELPNSPVIVAE